MKNCLNCRYEPEWGAWVGGEFKRRVGDCKYDVAGKVQYLIPGCHHLQMYPVTMHVDKSGLPIGCPTWEGK
jgi:hypothetical protein